MDKDIEKRFDTLENLINSLIKTVNNNKFYTDASINGHSQSITNLTPYVATKTAKQGDSEIIFDNVPEGALVVSIVETDGNHPIYEMESIKSRIRITFAPLLVDAYVTIIVKEENK